MNRPKLYLTALPVLVFKKHTLGLGEKRLLRLAEKGVSSLFDDSWIRSILVAQENPDPMAHANQVSVLDYRHTMKGAYILQTLNPGNEVSKNVLGRMFGQSQGMKAESGGWKLYNAEIVIEICGGQPKRNESEDIVILLVGFSVGSSHGVAAG